MTWRGASGRSADFQVTDARGAERAATMPLFAAGHGAGTLVWRGETPILKAALVADALAFANAVPATAEIANCCQDRYNFLVVFAACLLRGKPAILPHDARQPALLAVAEQFPGSLFAADHAIDAPRSLVRPVAFAGIGATAADANPEILADRPAAILFTSGSTGRAVAVARTWKWLAAGADDYVAGLSLDGLGGLSIVSTVPPQHSFGLEATVMLPLRTSASVHASRPLFPADVIKALASARAPAALVTTPFHLQILLRSKNRFPPIALVLCATSPLSKELAAEAERVFGAKVLEVYGCSEVGLVGTRRPTLSDAWRPGASLALSEARGRAFASARHFAKPIALPDRIALAKDGTFRLGERGDDIVKVAGHRASLAGLNAILRSIPGVADGAIVCRPGESAAGRARLAGFVVLDGRSLGEVRRELRASLAGPFMPRPLLEVPELPRGATGKIVLEPLLALLDKKLPRT